MLRLRCSRISGIIGAWFAVLCLGAAPCGAVEFTAGQSRDPFRNLLLGESAGPSVQGSVDYSLEGIVWSSQSPQAIINGEVVKAGDAVDGAEVIAIEKDGVRLSVNGQERVLKRRRS